MSLSAGMQKTISNINPM